MPPPIALFLCAVFVSFLLVLEGRGARGVSPALWIPTLWMLMIASRSLGAWFGNAGDNAAGSVLDQLALSALSLAGAVVLARRRFDWLGTLRRNPWLVALLAYMFVSTLWSDITLLALRRWVRELIVVIMTFVVMSEPDSRQALASLLRRTAYVLVPFSLLLVKYYPELGIQYGRWSGIQMWTGVAGQKNGLGRLCMISAFFLLWSLHLRWQRRAPAGGRYLTWADVSILLIAVVIFKGADSSTSLATLGVGIAMLLSLRLLRKLNLMVPRVGLLALMICLIAFGVTAPFLGGTTVATFSASLGRDDTLTGRTEVWAALMPAVNRQPLLGVGFGSFWTGARRLFYDIPTAHNGFLDVLLELGGVGLALYTVWLLSCTRKLHHALRQNYDWASLAICFLFMGVIYNVTESALNSLTEHMTAIVVLASLAVPHGLMSDHGKRRRRAPDLPARFPSGVRASAGRYSVGSGALPANLHPDADRSVVS